MNRYHRPEVKRDAREIAEAVHAGDMNEVAVPMVLVEKIKAGTGLPYMAFPWLHTAGMTYYKMRLKQLRA